MTESNGYNLGFSQRLLGHYLLSLGYSQSKSSYVATSASALGGRSDRVRSFDARLSTTLLRRGTVAILYRNGDNSSNTAGYGYKTEQYGFELGYRF